MIPSVQKFVFDPLLAAFIFALAAGVTGSLAWLCSRMGGVFADAIAPHANKVKSLEGLRGVLALSVAAHHAYCWYWFTQSGRWGTFGSILFGRFARFGVMQFFYISGYLFWRRLKKRGSIRLSSFYLSRFIRIGPVYYVCVGATLLLGFLTVGFHLQVTVWSLIRSLLPWAFFSIGGEPSVNGADVMRIVSGVVWTLEHEWFFYLTLPFLAWFSRKNFRLVLLVIALGCLFVASKLLIPESTHQHALLYVGETIRGYAKFMLIGFGGGILIATYESKLREWVKLSVLQANLLLAALYLIYLFTPGLEEAGEVLVLAGFALVVLGTDLFGLLTSKPIRLLGLISYDLYLVHGIVYYVAMRARGGIHPVKLTTYIAQTALCLVVILVISTIMHFAIERPSMKWSEAVQRKGDEKQAKAVTAEALRA
jgi:peptidoglycan/LPS O-acetylase OafA/YrhL